MDVERRRHVGLDRVEEPAELEGPLAPMALAITCPLAMSRAAKSEIVP